MRPILTLCAVVLLSTALLSGVAAADADDTAIVDRMGDEYAVVLVETDGETSEQRLVSVDELPSEAHEGAVLQIVDGEYVYDESATEERQAEMEERFDELSEEL